MLDKKKYPTNILAQEQVFFQQLQAYHAKAWAYADSGAQSAARALVPLGEWREELGPDLLLPSKLAPRLLRWFKLHFFTWVDTLPCQHCGHPTTSQGSLEPTSEELRWGGSRVEAHRCQSCALITRFPRYNDPVKLLSTRRGRCGEWANCFTLVGTSVGLEARVAYDETDHVWTEVWCPELGRWVHADACEAAFDTPLVYEQGWGKRLSYVIAFSPTEVVDVSWRYSKDHGSMMERRQRCRESRLVEFLMGLRQESQSRLSPSQRLVSDQRLIAELVQLMQPPRDAKPDETKGRSSGSTEWRSMRGELGAAASSGRVLVPTAAEVAGGELCLEYDVVRDEYRRGGDVERGWRSCVFQESEVARKEEMDWKVAYLARKVRLGEWGEKVRECVVQEGCGSEGSVSWRVDVSGVGVEWVRVGVAQKEVGSGRALVTVCVGDVCVRVPRGSHSAAPPSRGEGVCVLRRGGGSPGGLGGGGGG